MRKSLVENLMTIKKRIESERPLLLIDCLILSTLIDVTDTNGVELLHMLRNSSINNQPYGLKNSPYYNIIIQTIDKIINGDILVYTKGDNNKTSIVASPIRVVVPCKGGSDNSQKTFTIVPFIDCIITTDERLYNGFNNIKSQFPNAYINPLECLLNSGLEQKELCDLVWNLLGTTYNDIVYMRVNDEEEFFNLFKDSEGFIINYSQDQSLIVTSKNSKTADGGVEDVIVVLDRESLYETTPAVLDTIFM